MHSSKILSSPSFRSAAALFLLVLLAGVVPLLAQSYRGAIRGEVHDPSGAVIVGASVRALDTATGLERTTATADDGAYVLTELPAGDYKVTVEAKGFQTLTIKVAVVVGVETTADFAMRLPQQTDLFEVSDVAPLVETTSDVLGGTVENRLVLELPLNGRDFGKLVALVPGVTVEASGVAGSEKGVGQFNINGNRDRSNNYTLDGTDNNDPWFNNSALNQVGISGAPATLLPIDAIQEFNLQGQFAAEYGRNSGSVVNIITKSGTNQLHGSLFEFHRNSFFDARNVFNTRPNPQSGFVNNQFGGALGGPIIKDRTFFFGAYEGQRERVASDFVFTVPTLADRAAAFTLAQMNGLTLTSPYQPLEKLLNLFYPTGVAPATRTLPGSVNDKNDLDNFILKGDHRINAVHSVAVRYAFGQSDQTFPFGSFSFGGGSRFGRFAQESPTRVQVVSASWLSVFNGTHINEVRFGYTRFRNSFRGVDDTFDPKTQLGLDFGTNKLGLPEIDFSAAGNLENLGVTGFDIPRARISQTHQILDNFTWIRGSHTFKFGGEFRRAAVEHFSDTTQRGIFQFGPSGIVAPPPFNDPLIEALGNFYNGNLSFAIVTAGDTHRATYNHGLSFFGQDEWRLRPNLTLTAGLRWEYFGPLSEKNNLLSNLDASGNLVQVGSPTLKSLYERDLNNFGPRLGIAWTPFSRTVVRAAYGIYYDYVPQDIFLASFTNVEGSATNPIGPKPIAQFQPFGGGFVTAAWNGTTPGPVVNFAATGTNSIFTVDRHMRTPYVQTWNLNIERELTKSAALEIGYVGSKGTKLPRLLDLNNNFVTPNPSFPSFAQVARLADIANSTYHALQLTGRFRNWEGFSGFTSYTFSKSLDDASDGFDFTTNVAMPQDSTNIKAEHGPSVFDARHRYTLALNYEVPVWSRVTHWLAEGWQLNSILTAQSGKPIPISNNSSFFSDQRPDIVRGMNPILSHWTPSTGYLNPAAFALPAGLFGTLGRNRIYGPGFWNTDFSITKNTKVLESLTVQFRTEFFNIFNHPIYALPSGSITPGAAVPTGVISQTPDNAQGNPGLGGGGPRVLQFALRLKF
jgi:hypothetical protein